MFTKPKKPAPVDEEDLLFEIQDDPSPAAEAGVAEVRVGPGTIPLVFEDAGCGARVAAARAPLDADVGVGWRLVAVNGIDVAGVGAELATGETLPAQFHDHVFSLAFVSTLVFLASFAPGFMAKSYTSEPSTKGAFGPFSPGKELVHGRLAMVGLAAAFYLEATTGHAFWVR